MTEEKRLHELVDEFAAKLGEHFDSVQIMTSWNSFGDTHALFVGRGNWYSRQGLAHEFITKDKAQVAADELSRVMPTQED